MPILTPRPPRRPTCRAAGREPNADFFKQVAATFPPCTKLVVVRTRLPGVTDHIKSAFECEICATKPKARCMLAARFIYVVAAGEHAHELRAPLFAPPCKFEQTAEQGCQVGVRSAAAANALRGRYAGLVSIDGVSHGGLGVNAPAGLSLLASRSIQTVQVSWQHPQTSKNPHLKDTWSS
jgi:hypothetical protein